MTLKRDSPNLDVLRAFAVTAVLVNHLAQVTPWGKAGGTFALNDVGRAGVLIFFVHTALVLMGSLQRLDARGEGSRLFSAFYSQRFCRLYPLSMTCVAGVLVVHLAVPSWHLPWVSFRAVVANLALVQNLTWDRSAIWPLWSLPYEVQMYAVLPFIYLMTKRRGALVYVAVLWVVAAIVGTYLFRSNPRYLGEAYQYPFPWFVPTFLGGVIAFILRKQGARLPAVLWPILIIGIFLVYQMIPMRRGELVMTLLGFAIPQFQEVTNSPMRAIAHQIAKYSYGIYLLHAPFLELCFVRLHSLGVAVQCALFFSLLVGSSLAAYHWIEKPMIDVGHRISRRMVREPSNRGMADTVVPSPGNVL